MATLLRKELAEKFSVACQVGRVGFLGGLEASDVARYSAHAYLGAEHLVAVEVYDAAEPCLVGGAYQAISSVLRACRNTQVGASVVEPISVRVIDKHCAVCQSEHEAMHEQRRSSPAFSDGGFGVDRAGVPMRQHAPSELRDYGVVGIVDKGYGAPSQGNLDHDCSFGNTLCGVTAARKVRGFGDQPSRDTLIVGAQWL